MRHTASERRINLSERRGEILGFRQGGFKIQARKIRIFLSLILNPVPYKAKSELLSARFFDASAYRIHRSRAKSAVFQRFDRFYRRAAGRANFVF